MQHHQPHPARHALVRYFAGRRRARAAGDVVVGHHNSNHILPLGQPLAYLLGMDSGQVRAKFRMPLETVEVVPRIWRESEVLRVVSARLDDVPRCLWDFGEWSLHAYVTGRPLSEEPADRPLGVARIAELAGLFAKLATVPAEELPALPADWPEDGDSAGFLHRLAHFADHRVHRHNLGRFGALFAALGVRPGIVGDFLATRPALTRRPFILLHTDVHRANVIVTPTPEGERLTLLDWELSLFGDPLHDLATHVVRMGYDEGERKLAVDLWADAMRRAGRPELTAALDPDLATYLGFEYVQSVFPDVMRAALALPDEAGPEHYADAALRICGALERAREPLGHPDAPADPATAAAALREWHARDLATWPRTPPDAPATATGPGTGPGWCADADQPRGIDAMPAAASGGTLRPERTPVPADLPGRLPVPADLAERTRVPADLPERTPLPGRSASRPA
ncbi:phosphotransferase [Streptomyces sp. NPDC093252]|uniref:phosphotransferase family protein n=1 Tax=Streptomyces sp. NPDC093252 TaxID=3154980 RepID=UPI003417C3DD